LNENLWEVLIKHVTLSNDINAYRICADAIFLFSVCFRHFWFYFLLTCLLLLISICILIFDILNVKHENPMLNIKDNSEKKHIDTNENINDINIL
jgi:hypothetical protein